MIPKHVWVILIGILVAGVAAWVMVSGPAVQSDTSGTVVGETDALFDGRVVTWAELGQDQTVTAVGATLKLTTVRNAPTAQAQRGTEGDHQHVEAHSVRLDLPKVARETTYFDHLQIDYNPAGHAPTAYEVPHFDFHFYGIDTDEQLAIDCTDRTMPPDALVPSDYQVLPPRPEPEGGCVPEMGNHAVDTRAPELRPEDPAPFTQTLILGYYGGELTFVEPMITRQFLLQHEEVERSVPVPERVGRSTRYPTSFEAVYDEAEQAYRLIWSDFVAKD